MRNSRGQVNYLFWANDRVTNGNNFPLVFRWSCLAEGSMVVMSDGTLKAVEDVKLGDMVFSATEGKAIEVVDISSGGESAPMVKVESDNGTIMVTEGHPFFSKDGAALRADELTVGAVIQTADGTATVKKLTRVPYDGQVYNLKLGTDARVADLDSSKINYRHHQRDGSGSHERYRWYLPDPGHPPVRDVPWWLGSGRYTAGCAG